MNKNQARKEEIIELKEGMSKKEFLELSKE